MIAIVCVFGGVTGILSLTRRGRVFKSAFGASFDTPGTVHPGIGTGAFACLW
jgi:hypothetical protein